MSARAVVEASIDPGVMEEATAIYAAVGLTPSEVFRIMLLRTVADHAVPFDLFIPNQTTIEAMSAARRGELVTVGTVEGLMADLHADD